jgi:serine/threonine protein kinase
MSSPLITLQGLGPLPEVMEGVADDLLRDLLMRMLEPRPASRISASGALCHPYCE